MQNPILCIFIIIPKQNEWFRGLFYKILFWQGESPNSTLLTACWGHVVLTLPSPFLPPAGMRILVTLLLDTLPMLGNVLLLCFFVFFIFGIVGVQLWVGRLRNRCFVEDTFPL